MAIGFVGCDAAVEGANSITPTIHTNQLTTDMMLLIVGGKPFNSAWSVPAGWTSLGSAASGSTAAGVDTGSMKLEVWYREATSDTETNPLVTEGTPAWNVVGCLIPVFSKGADETWDTPVAVFGADESSGTGLSFTFASDPGVTAGDLIVCAAVMNTDAMGPLTAVLTPAQTGVTFGSTTLIIDDETTLGGDMAEHISRTPVNSGTGSAAPTATGTGTASGGADRSEAVFIRLRVAAATSLAFPRREPRLHLPNRDFDPWSVKGWR